MNFKHFLSMSILIFFSVNFAADKPKLSEGEQKKLDEELVEAIYKINNETVLEEKVEKLLKAGANPNAIVIMQKATCFAHHGNALHLALKKGRNSKILKLLLDHGADPKLRFSGFDSFFSNKLSAPPIFVAASEGNLDAVILLHSKGADINFVFDGKTPLIKAAEFGKDNVMDYLILMGADKNYKDEKGATYKEYRLAYALQYEDEQLEKIKELLQGGANPNIEIDFKIPLINAFNLNNFDNIKLLLDYGADPYMPYKDLAGKDQLVIKNAKNEQKEFIEKYYKEIRQKKIKGSLEHIMPKELIKIISEY